MVDAGSTANVEMLPATMRGDVLVVWRVISLSGENMLAQAHIIVAVTWIYLYNRDDIGGGSFEFAHVDIKMVQLVLFGLVQDDVGAFAHCMDAP